MIEGGVDDVESREGFDEAEDVEDIVGDKVETSYDEI